MTVRWYSHAERPELSERMRSWSDGWPAFIFHDDVADVLYGRLTIDFPDDQHYLVANGEVLGAIASVPVSWGGTAEDLPSGWDDALRRGIQDRRLGRPPDALCALAAQVAPGSLGQGLSSVLLERFRTSARAQQFRSVIAPVRPVRKHLYPLIPMASYAAWRRPDGSHFDPWLRTHERVGGRIVAIADRSMVVTGTVEEWEEWCGLELPGSGLHIVPGALVPVDIDRQRDVGRYVEPNVWMVHDTARARTAVTSERSGSADRSDEHDGL